VSIASSAPRQAHHPLAAGDIALRPLFSIRLPNADDLIKSISPKSWSSARWRPRESSDRNRRGAHLTRV